MRKLFTVLTLGISLLMLMPEVEARRRTASILASATSTGVNGVLITIDSTGGNLLLGCAGWYAGITADPTTFSDNLGGVYTGTGKQVNSTPTAVNCGYTNYASPTVGNPTQLTIAGAGMYMGAGFAALGGINSAGGSLADQDGTTAAGTNTITTPAVTCTEDNCIYITALMFEDNGGGTVSVDSGFSLINSVVPWGSGANEGFAWASFVQCTAAAVTPQWNVTNSSPGLAAVTLAFKGPGGTCGGGGGSAIRLRTPIIIMDPREKH